jgi:F-type H+-transporting ATPase subunit a
VDLTTATKHRPVNRYIVLVLMIAGFVLGTIYAPVRPEITVAAEKLIEEPLFEIPGIGPFYLVNTIPTLVLTLILIIWIVFSVNRAVKKSEKDLVPHGIGGVFEALLELLYNMTEGSAGAKWAPKIFPWFATIMIYVLFANLLKILPGFETIGLLRHEAIGHPVQYLGPIAYIAQGEVEGGSVLIPFLRGISVDLNFTFSLALIAVVFIQVVGFQTQGFGYLGKFFNVRRMFTVPFFGAMDFFVGLLELISEISKVLSFAFRLFFNMFAGIILVAVVASLMGKITILPSMLYMFELFIGVIQAFVFGMLTMVFMSMATQGHEEEHTEAPSEVHEM